jgi:hypothetical protein
MRIHVLCNRTPYSGAEGGTAARSLAGATVGVTAGDAASAIARVAACAGDKEYAADTAAASSKTPKTRYGT